MIGMHNATDGGADAGKPRLQTQDDVSFREDTVTYTFQMGSKSIPYGYYAWSCLTLSREVRDSAMARACQEAPHSSMLFILEAILLKQVGRIDQGTEVHQPRV